MAENKGIDSEILGPVRSPEWYSYWVGWLKGNRNPVGGTVVQDAFDLDEKEWNSAKTDLYGNFSQITYAEDSAGSLALKRDLKTWLEAHPDILKRVPLSFHPSLEEMLYRMIQEKNSIKLRREKKAIYRGVISNVAKMSTDSVTSRHDTQKFLHSFHHRENHIDAAGGEDEEEGDCVCPFCEEVFVESDVDTHPCELRLLYQQSTDHQAYLREREAVRKQAALDSLRHIIQATGATKGPLFDALPQSVVEQLKAHDSGAQIEEKK